MKISNDLIGNVHSIETFGAFDGPGLRYILFLQGCPFQCKFCHNRDTWSTEQNKSLKVSEVLEDYNKYRGFYGTKGGLTVSGGEPILQLSFLIELFKNAKAQGISTCLDTSAACYNEKQNDKYKELLKYTDWVLLDIKQMDNKKHIDFTGNPNTQVLEFAKFLSDLQIKTYIRHVLVPGYTDNEENLNSLRAFIDTLTNVVKIEILPYHTAGTSKWKEMGLKYPLEGVKEPTKESVKWAHNILTKDYKYMKK